MATMMEYFKEIMQEDVQDFDEENENHFLEQESVIIIHNIDNECCLTVSVDEVDEKVLPAYLADILAEVPEIKKNIDKKTTEIYLRRYQIEKIIKKIQEIYEITSNESVLELGNYFKKMV